MANVTRRHLLKASFAGALLPSVTFAADDTREALREGGCVIYFRHAATTWSGVDRIEWPRERQRLLSDLGVAQSEEIGAAFRAEGFPVGEVLASPFARCRDMAEIAFGRVEERMELLGLLSDTEGRAGRVAYLRERMTTPPAAGKNRIIVSHRSNIAEVAGARLAEGEAVIVRPNDDGFDTLAQWMPNDWALA
ncbi:MAG: histidine phosphatase family protein [Pseudomonadota bacterium]